LNGQFIQASVDAITEDFVFKLSSKCWCHYGRFCF